MADKRALQLPDTNRLDSVIKRMHPTLTDSQVRRVRSKLLRYVEKGLADGYDIALIKALSKEEMRIKVLHLEEE